MHSTVVVHQNEEIYIHYNGDFSGDVLLTRPETYKADVEIPFEVMKAVVGEYLKQRKISLLEDTKPQDLIDMEVSF